MRAVLQRVSQASVRVNSEVVGEIKAGILIFLGIHRDDTKTEVQWLTDKIITLRIFEDSEGIMNRSLLDSGGALLVVSQFTLYGDCRKGRRPGYSAAASPAQAKLLYQDFIETLQQKGVSTASGHFQAHMDVQLHNDGPITLLMDSSKLF